VLDVAFGYENPLVALQALGFASMVESFDLLVYSSYCLNLTLLIYRSGNREVLLDGKVGEGGQNRVEFGAGSAVTVDSTITLLEDESTGDAQGFVTRILVL